MSLEVSAGLCLEFLAETVEFQSTFVRYEHFIKVFELLESLRVWLHSNPTVRSNCL